MQTQFTNTAAAKG